MSTNADAKWRDTLLTLRAELLSASDIGDESADIVELDQSKVGRLSRMDAMQAQAMAKASATRRAAMMRRITLALKRLDSGEFGLCLCCDEAINPKRLDFDPTTTLCVECVSAREQR